MAIKIKNWSVICAGPYAPPEHGQKLHGEKEDGRFVKTSRIMDVVGRIVHTESGSQYELLEPSPTWLEWLRENNIDPPTDEVPIRMNR